MNNHPSRRLAGTPVLPELNPHGTVNNQFQQLSLEKRERDHSRRLRFEFEFT